MQPRIKFHNEPKLSEHEVDANFNERRVNLVSHIRNFVAEHSRFKGQDVGVTFIHKGISSLVCIIETLKEKLVLKIPLSISHVGGEAQFLKVWEQSGVCVPHIIETGMMCEHSYILMAYVDAPLLKDIYDKVEMLTREVYAELGKILYIMHKPNAVGYGRYMDGSPEFLSFKDWLESEDIKNRIEYVKEHKLLGEEHGSSSLVFKILIEHVNRENKSSYCHDDFGTNNTFATEPLTIFDPSPRFNNGYIDLGRTIMKTVAYDEYANNEAGAQLVKGYFEGREFNEKALHAAVLLSAYMKFPYWHKRNNLNGIKNTQEYLARNKHKLNM